MTGMDKPALRPAGQIPVGCGVLLVASDATALVAVVAVALIGGLLSTVAPGAAAVGMAARSQFRPRIRFAVILRRD